MKGQMQYLIQGGCVHSEQWVLQLVLVWGVIDMASMYVSTCWEGKGDREVVYRGRVLLHMSYYIL